QLGHGDTKRLEAPKLIEGLADQVIVSAACGRNHTMALTGRRISYNGQPLVKVACGAEFSMVVDCKGNLYSFGCPEYGQLGKNHHIYQPLHLYV
ncbi:Protein rcc2, partial [Goodea atripinnis]